MMRNLFARAAVAAAFSFLILSSSVSAQARRPVKKPVVRAASSSMPVVTRIDIEGLKKLLKPADKPLLINFWATWCDPCREEFPDLVKLSALYKGKLDIVTVSLDDLADIKTFVPKFLKEMKADMPAYLLRTDDEDAAMKAVTPDWAGNLPMTIIFNKDGSTAYLRKGKLHIDAVTAEIDKVLGQAPAAGTR